MRNYLQIIYAFRALNKAGQGQDKVLQTIFSKKK